MEVPVVADDKNAIIEQMSKLPFKPCVKSSFYGLPVRLKWQLWVQILGWKVGEGSEMSTASLIGVAQLGHDGHFFELRTGTGTGVSHAFGGEEASLPRGLFESYQQRSDKIKLELVRSVDNVAVAYCRFALKELVPEKPIVGWLKLKDPEDKKRNVGTMHVGFVLSQSGKAETLFLLDFRDCEVLFYQEVPTLEDLNPAYDTPSMTPFRWVAQKGLWALHNNAKELLCSMQLRQTQDTSVVSIVRIDQPEYWQSTMTHDREQPDRYVVDGSWDGVVTLNQVNRQVSKLDVTRRGVRVGHAEWRNARDMKCSVDAFDEDPVTILSVILSFRLMQP